jgi:flavin reductase (DIM6/NTAB) family NADH-FMN oxidoreductase RutF
MVAAVNRLAKTTGSNPIPTHKAAFGYRHEADKFGTAGLTQSPSETVRAPRVTECPVQLEAVLVASHAIADGEEMSGFAVAFEMRIQRVHLSESIMMDDVHDRIDPNKWRPLIMSFQQFYGLGPRLQESILAEIPEALYRCPDVDRARNISGSRN